MDAQDPDGILDRIFARLCPPAPDMSETWARSCHLLSLALIQLAPFLVPVLLWNAAVATKLLGQSHRFTGDTSPLRKHIDLCKTMLCGEASMGLIGSFRHIS